MIAVSVTGLMGLAVSLAVRVGGREPVYRGRAASYWLTAPIAASGPTAVLSNRRVVLVSNGVKWTNIVVVPPSNGFGDLDAFQAIGEEGWGFLAAAAGRRDSWPRKIYRRVYSGTWHSWVKRLPSPGPPEEARRMRAMEILAEIYPQPTNLVSVLYPALADPSSPIQEAAYRHLIRSRPGGDALSAEIGKRPLQTLPYRRAFGICMSLKPDFESVRPFIENTLSSTNAYDREHGLMAAESCVRDSETLVQYAVTALHDPNAEVRYRAVYVLLDLGTNAVAALPELRNLRDDASVIVRNGARRAIGVIQGSSLPTDEGGTSVDAR